MLNRQVLYDFNPLTFVETWLWPSMWPVLVNVLCILEESVYFLVVEDRAKALPLGCAPSEVLPEGWGYFPILPALPQSLLPHHCAVVEISA